MTGTTALRLAASRLHPSFVAEVRDLDLSQDHDEDTIAAVREVLLEHSILVFRGQRLGDAEHVRFSRRFGPLEIHTVKQYLLPDHPEILALANRGEKGTKPVANGGAYWHSDITYKARPPMGSILHGIEIPPEGGDTLYCDMYAAYESLPAETRRRIAGLKAIHSYLPRFLKQRALDPSYQQDGFELSETQKAELAEVVHPMVRTHPETGRKALFVNEGFTIGVQGMEDAEARALLDELHAHATQQRFIYRHRWHPGDVVFWDNRCTMHCATDYDQRHARRMHRTTIQGDAPF